MPKDDNHDAGPSALPGSPSDSNHETSSGAFLPSAELTAKLKKLANRRLDLSSIEFVNGAPEFRGGFATVARASLVPPSSVQDRTYLFNRSENDFTNPVRLPKGTSRRRKDVAVKKMKISAETAPKRILGLALREAEFLVGLSHENVIELEGFVEDLAENVVWLVFPWAENGNLRNFIASAEWEIPERIWLINDVAKGVEYLHSRKPPIRHGDLKSVNILINSQYRAMITDFGSARRVTAEDPNKQRMQAKNEPQAGLSLEPKFDETTNTIGITLTSDQYTLRWAAPELLQEEEATVASDTWALGCVAYEVMTNSIPFQDIKDTIVVMRIIQGDLPSITDNARMLLIQALCSMILACWSIDPRKRPTAENCRESIKWMPKIRPDPIRTVDAAATRARSPALLIQLGLMHRRQGDYPNALAFFNEALGSYGDGGDSKRKATALLEVAQIHRLRNEYSQAVTFYTKALQIHTAVDDRQGRASALSGLAHVHRLRDEYSQAVTFYSEALQIYTDIGNKQGRANVLQGLAHAHLIRNEYSQAMTFYTEALQIRTDIGDRQGKAKTLSSLAGVHLLRNEYIQAMAFYTEAIQILTDTGGRRGRATALLGLAEVHRVRNEYSQAVTFYTEALQICTDIGNRQGRADALSGLAHVHRVQNEYSQAVTLYTEALQIRTDIGDRQGRATALRDLAHVHRLQDYYSQATTLFSEALETFADIDSQSGRASSLSGLGDVRRDQGNYREAIGHYTEAAEIFEQIGNAKDAAYASNQAAEARRLSTREETT